MKTRTLISTVILGALSQQAIGAGGANKHDLFMSLRHTEPLAQDQSRDRGQDQGQGRDQSLVDQNFAGEEKVSYQLIPYKESPLKDHSLFASPLSNPVWPLDLIHIKQAHELPGGQGEGQSVCLVDTGVDLNHPQLKGVVLGGRNFINEANPDDISDSPSQKHGTLLATLIAGRSLSMMPAHFTSVAPRANLWIAKVFDENGRTDNAAIAKALLYCGERSKIINLSFGGPTISPMVSGILQELRDKGISVFASAGNNGPKEPLLFPANQPSVVAVSSINTEGLVSRFSPMGENIGMVAPGEYLPIANATGVVSLYSGTSFTSAIASGVEAIRRSRQSKSLKFQDLGLPKNQQGRGLIDAALTALDL